MDPFLVTPAERARFEQQFAALKPVNGIVTGDQAKGFFMQSQLPLQHLGLIWGLADTDADGKMNINEFSIACKLINLKLRGFEIPKTLPPALQQLVTQPVAPGVQPMKPPVPPMVGSMPVQPPLIPGMPVSGVAPPIRPPVSQPVNRVISPTSPQLMPQPLQMAAQPGSVPLQNGQIPVRPPQPVLPAPPYHPPHGVQPIVSTQAGVIPPVVLPTQPLAPQPLVGVPPVIPLQTSIVPSQPIIPEIPPLPLLATQPLVAAPPVPTQPLQGVPAIPPLPKPVPTAVPPNSLSGLVSVQPQVPVLPPSQPSSVERVSSVESPLALASPLVEWAVPQNSKLKYTQLFNSIDKTRSGFLTGPQTRNVLLASKLPQLILAQIWGLADTDTDGRLSCEEFVLAMHLCDLARSGETLPSALPPNLVPPTLRRQRNNSLSTSEPGDAASLLSNVTFEDKRKENFEKGQAELDRRRKALLEIQRQEQAERERKEREEREKQERIRLEQERKRQEEFERQVEKQKELEKAKEEERKRAQEQREAARREMERQRQLEWENQRLQELTAQRQKQQELVLSLKAKSQSLTIELSQKEDKVKELSKQISETRCGVTSVKSFIDGMRATRDENMAEYNRLKSLLKQKNQQLVALSQQKAKLEAQGKLGKESDEQHRLAFNNKQIVIKNLKEKLESLEEEVKTKQSDLENNNTQLDGYKQELSTILTECEELYNIYDDKRNKILSMKGERSHTSAWGDDAWNSAPSQDWPEEEVQDIPGYAKYRALYEFVARNEDELSFQPGDIILVSTTVHAEPGWLSGELRGMSGWFPESYVEPVSGTGSSMIQTSLSQKTPLEGIAEVAENISESGSLTEEGPSLPIGLDPILGLGQGTCKSGVARYSFTAKKSSQLSFNKGDTINISELQDQWCYGELNGSEGWIPKSYVTLEDPPPQILQSATTGTTSGLQEYYVALYPYQSEEVGDLIFDQGETILVVAKEGEWWTGMIGDRSGIFPSNYVTKCDDVVTDGLAPSQVNSTPSPVISDFQQTRVEEVKPAASPVSLEPQATSGVERAVTPDFASLSKAQMESASGDDSDSKTGSGKTKKPEIATVIAPYQGTSSEQLSLQRGQLVMIRKKTTTGWWEGELQARGRKKQIGWFPASYVKLLGGGGSTPKPSSQANSKSVSPAPPDSSGERVIALYQYVAQNEDELSFEKDDIIVVRSKEEPSWWKGELNGNVGLFPSNYVGPLCTPTVRKVKISSDEKKRQQHIKELISTEEAYLEDMSLVHEVFEKPLIESRVISKELIKGIFINWRDISACNYAFLRALRVRRDMSEGGIIRIIGDILCENIPRMTVYVRFCSCQLASATLLQSLFEENKDFNALAKRCQSDPRTKGFPLSYFLIKPMQRITRYPLIIQKILNHTPHTHPDKQHLEEALSKAEELCSQVNEGVRETENSEHLEWLQSHLLTEGLTEPLTFNSLTNAIGPRKFLHHGVLSKTKSGKELVGFLMNDFLLLAQPNRPLGGQFSFKKHVSVLFKMYKQPLLLSDTMILPTPSSSDSLEIRLEHNRTSFNLSAPTVNERALWLKKLQEAQADLKEHEKLKLQRQKSKQASFGACGRILVLVVEANHLKASSSVKREVFCEVSMGSQENRTDAVPVPPTSNPKWNSSMQFLVKDLEEDVLCVTVKDKGHFSPDEFLGRSELRVSEILKATHDNPGPILKTLKLREVRTGEVTLKLDLRLFDL